MLKDLSMSIGEILKYREILSEKVEKARKSGNMTTLNPTLVRMDQIDMLIDIAFQSTVMKHQPYLEKLIDIRMFDREALKSILSPARYLQLPTQGILNFTAVEDVSGESVSGNTKEAKLTAELVELLKRSFTKRIDDSVVKYREETGSKEPNAKVWIKIKDLVAENTLVRNWDKVICDKIIEEGPVMGFFMAKKHLPTWNDVDIALLVDNAVMRSTDGNPARRERVIGILEAAPGDVKGYMNSEASLKALLDNENLQDKKLLGRRIAEITRICAPSKRAEVLSKKEYVEKGY